MPRDAYAPARLPHYQEIADALAERDRPPARSFWDWPPTPREDMALNDLLGGDVLAPPKTLPPLTPEEVERLAAEIQEHAGETSDYGRTPGLSGLGTFAHILGIVILGLVALHTIQATWLNRTDAALEGRP